ncbi:MAG: lytic transglycosylase domain-containing protein [Aestuariibacter sp.]|nr:lytic transglycosylase domain-containing protein [Aestuariibacter sp.]
MPQKEFEQFRHNLGMEKTSHEFKLRDALGESDFERRYRKMPDLSATKQLPTEGIDYSTAPFMSKLSKTNRNNLNEYMPIIRDAAKKYGVPVEMVIAVMHRESRFNPNARGAAGEIGLMQLMPGTARELGVSDPTNPLQNIHGGVRYLREKLDDNGGDEALAMAAYNAGQGNVNKYGGIPFKTTREYVRTNLANMEELRGMSQEPAYTATNIQVGSSGWQADYVETGQADAGGGFDPSSIDGLVVSSAKLGDDGKWSFTFKPPEDVTPGDVLNDVSKYRQGLMDYAQKRFVVSDGAKPNPKMVYDAEKGNAWVTERMNEYMAAMPPHLRGMLTPQGSVQSATPSGQAGSGVGALLETVVPQMQNAQIPAEDADIGEYIIPNDPNNP